MGFNINKRQEYEEIMPQTNPKFQKVLVSLVTSGTVIVLLIGSISLISQPSKDIILNQKYSIISSEDIIVKVANGWIRGRQFLKSRDGRPFSAFEGVPFASPPTGNGRFALPKHPKSWKGILDGTKPKPQCLQIEYKNAKTIVAAGSEDCLYLNIYTPKDLNAYPSRVGLFPVIFYIHGGVENGNGSRYKPDYFMDEDVVLVQVHYRLHVFGKLSTSDGMATGNWALKDQTMALHWIQRNIHAFGGDKNRVTLYGISFGAMTASFHTFSPISNGLFHQLILHSGSLLSPGSVVRPEKNQKLVEDLAMSMNCSITNSTAILSCLRQCNAADLTLAAQNLDFKFVVEPKGPQTRLETTSIPDEPLVLLKNGNFQDVPSIQGLVSSEQLVQAISILQTINQNNTSATNFVNLTDPYFLNLLNFNPNESGLEMAKKCEEYYFENSNYTNRDILLRNLTDLLTDRNHLHPLKTLVHFQLRSNISSPVYLYYFTQESDYSYADSKKKEWGTSSIPFGVAHADDVRYYFPSSKFINVKHGSTFYNFSKEAVKMWVNFAATGQPRKVDKVTWEPNTYDTLRESPKSLQWLEFREQFRMNTFDELDKRLKFWDSFNIADLYF